MKTILAPIDFSSATIHVLAAAGNLARSVDGRVVLLNITQLPTPIGDSSGFSDDYTELTDRAVEAAVAELKLLQQKLEADHIATDVLHLVGKPIGLILAQAKELPADFIVLGSHGHTALYDLLIGSTASGVLKRATCPVVIVPVARRKPAQARRRAASATAGVT